jgi:predicted dehydrogenase
MNYAPQGIPRPVVQAGELKFAAIGLDHDHINGMCGGLLDSGGDLKWVFDPDRKKCEEFKITFPRVTVASSEQQVLQDADVRLVAGAAMPSTRCDLGIRILEHGKS